MFLLDLDDPDELHPRVGDLAEVGDVLDLVEVAGVEHLTGRIGVGVMDAPGHVVRVVPVHVGDVAAEKAVLADGDAVGLALLETEVDAESPGLPDGLEVVDAVHDQRPLGVLLEEGALVEALAGVLVPERPLIDVRRGWIEGVGERRVPLADGALGDAFDRLAKQKLGGEDAAACDNQSEGHANRSFRPGCGGFRG